VAIRFRAHLRYNVGSGYAAWLAAQMQVRLGMAFHLREGEPGQELSRVTTDIVTGGNPSNRRENIAIDVFWPDARDDLAADTRATIEATIPWLRPNEAGARGGRSWMDWHRCSHDAGGPCPAPEWRWPT
jgi:hypothetical protein